MNRTRTRRPMRAFSPRPAESQSVDEALAQLTVSQIAGLSKKKPPAPAAWNPSRVAPIMLAMAGVFGVYLSYSVLRLQELYPVLAVPHLPMIMSIVVAVGVLAATSTAGWKYIWNDLMAVRWQALLVVLSVVTAPIGIWMGGSLHFVMWQYSLSVVVFISTVVLLRDRRAMTAALTLVLATATVVAAYTFSSSAQIMGESGRVRLGVTLDPNDLAQILVALAPLALAMGMGRGWWKRIWIVSAILMAIAIVPTQSRGGELGLAVVALVLMGNGTSRWRRFVNIIGVVVVAAGFVLVAHQNGASRMDSFSDYSGGEGRLAIWKRGIYWMVTRPWGYGADNFALYFGWLNGPERAAHNSFVEIGMELGVMGLTAFTMIWFVVIRALVRQRAHARALIARIPAARREATLAMLMIASCAGTIVTGFFLAKAYAAVTLFIQGLACAVLLGYPYRDESAPVRVPEVPAVSRTPSGRLIR